MTYDDLLKAYCEVEPNLANKNFRKSFEKKNAKLDPAIKRCTHEKYRPVQT